MKRPAGVACLLLALATPAVCASGEEVRAAYERSVVGLNVTFQAWDDDRPWIKRKPEYRRAYGVIVGAGRILTTAQMLDDVTFLQMEILGRTRPIQPKIERIDWTINLALLSLDAAASGGLAPATLAERTPTSGTLRTVRWRSFPQLLFS